jgi:hypothetical protein
VKHIATSSGLNLIGFALFYEEYICLPLRRAIVVMFFQTFSFVMPIKLCFAEKLLSGNLVSSELRGNCLKCTLS